jgi:hypothetical protein
MAIYHLYYLRGGELIGSDDIDAPHDQAAVRMAEAQGRGELVEIWNTTAKVRVVRPGGARDPILAAT